MDNQFNDGERLGWKAFFGNKRQYEKNTANLQLSINLLIHLSKLFQFAMFEE